jgi:Zn finger protein HypA/HybF involved in hydrogenase expression
MTKIEEYNEEPVWYCGSCYSLKIVEFDMEDISCVCETCGSTNVIESGPNGIIEVLELQERSKTFKK